MSDSDNQNTNTNTDPNFILAITALVVSLIALITTILQVLQQYLDSATVGYRRCTKRVMGDWGGGTSRRFRWRELRFEVLFETPVIWLAPPDNKKGPMGDNPIFNLDGTNISCINTHTKIPGERNDTKLVHTANDEQASWVTLLFAIQREERESRYWETKLTGDSRPEQKYRIVHQLQKKTRSWDFMPESTTKPYATTTLCHLVEMVGLLGMSWKQFDIQRGDLAAEGNGYVFSSTLVRGLGILMTFSVISQSVFEERRVIPCNGIKSLVFGVVPSIMDRPLEVGSPELVKRTLATFGCDRTTMDDFEKKNKRTYMFSVTFEIVAMLAQPFRLQNSMFRVLPNPTSDKWIGHVTKISWVDAMEAFQQNMSTYHSQLRLGGIKPHPVLTEIENQWNKIKTSWDEMQNTWKHLPVRRRCTDYGSERKRDIDFAAKMDLQLRELIHQGLLLVDEYIKPDPIDLDDDSETQNLTGSESHVESYELASVMASHIKWVLKESEDLDRQINLPGGSSTQNIINYYFETIRDRVEREGPSVQTAAERRKRGAIWITLMYRMISWSLLHDFDVADVNIVPSELKGSRMPVFIG